MNPPVVTRVWMRRLLTVAMAVALAATLAPMTASAATPTATRSPYLTDSTADHLTVNVATNMSTPMPQVTWGPAGGSCANSTATADLRTTITVGGTTEYQYRVQVRGLVADTPYCYRVIQGTTFVDGGARTFRSGIAAGDPTPYSFAVLGDSGGGSGGSFPTDESNIMSRIAASGARLVVNTGDIANGSGDQSNYGDLTHSNSFIFGPDYWPKFGSSVPAFVAPGNHGSMSVAVANWAQPGVVAESGGTYSSSGEWYAFDYGVARFYILTAVGSGSDTNAKYKNDYDTHWAPGMAERTWLTNDLAAHRGTLLKFALFHYPLYTDNSSEKTDPYLDGAANLEGLLASNGVSIVFNGHAHIYERNLPQISGSPMVSYVDGASAAYPTEPINKCSAFDGYSIGWSSSGASSCNAPKPASRANFFSFLIVSVNGNRVTVTPTDSTGRTFDVQTYTFGTAPPPTTGSIAGTITDATSHAAIAGATVTAGSASTSTAANGTYRIDSLAPATYTVTATKAGYGAASRSVTVTAGTTQTVDLALTAVPPPPSITLPVRAAFYYPWFPETWASLSDPFTNYHPSLGYYDSADPAVIASHIAAMQYGHIDVGIASWWGQGQHDEDARIPLLLQGAAGTGFKWALYYENEGYADPSSSQIASDLSYIVSRYGSDPSYARVNGRPVVFVYAGPTDACGMADRWAQANSGINAYVVLKVFAGYAACTSQPAGWHQYAPAVAEDAQPGYSYSISPGFWKKGEAVRLARDPVAWSADIRNMIASNAPWQLVTTFDEWGEGTSVESATEWASASGFGTYLDALHDNGGTPPPPTTGSIAGTITDATSHAAIAGATVTAGSASTSTAANGTYRIDSLAPATYTVTATKAGYGAASRSVTVTAGTTQTVDLALTAVPPPPTTGSIAGTITDATSHAAIAGATVGDGTTTTTTGPGGAYRLDGLAPGSHTITASMPSYSPTTATASVTAGATTTLDLALAPIAPPPHTMVFTDGFESGDLSMWTTYGGLSVQGTYRHTGQFGVQGSTTVGRTYAKKLFASTYTDGYARSWFDIISAAGNVNVLRLRTAADGSLGYVTVTSAGHLTFHSDVSGSTTAASAVTVSKGSWHELELHAVIAGSSGRIEVWLDGAPVPELTTTVNLGTTPIGKVQIGEVNGTGTWNVVWDDVAFDTQRIG